MFSERIIDNSCSIASQILTDRGKFRGDCGVAEVSSYFSFFPFSFLFVSFPIKTCISSSTIEKLGANTSPEILGQCFDDTATDVLARQCPTMSPPNWSSCSECTYFCTRGLLFYCFFLQEKSNNNFNHVEIWLHVATCGSNVTRKKWWTVFFCFLLKHSYSMFIWSFKNNNLFLRWL